MTDNPSILDLSDKTASITFAANHDEVGRLYIFNGALHFEGNVEESARILLREIVKLSKDEIYLNQLCIEQACEAITENISNSSESDYIKGFDDGLRGAIQTIKEQIK